MTRRRRSSRGCGRRRRDECRTARETQHATPARRGQAASRASGTVDDGSPPRADWMQGDLHGRPSTMVARTLLRVLRSIPGSPLVTLFPGSKTHRPGRGTLCANEERASQWPGRERSAWMGGLNVLRARKTTQSHETMSTRRHEPAIAIHLSPSPPPTPGACAPESTQFAPPPSLLFPRPRPGHLPLCGSVCIHTVRAFPSQPTRAQPASRPARQGGPSSRLWHAAGGIPHARALRSPLSLP